MSIIIKWLVSRMEEELQTLEVEDDPFPRLLRFEDLKTRGSSSSKRFVKVYNLIDIG